MNTIQRNNAGSTAGALIYPKDMKSDTDKGAKGQDRIEFSLNEYSKKLQDNTFVKEKIKYPFPDIRKRGNENLQYTPAKIDLGKGIGLINRVFLPIQDKIQDQNGVEWGGGELNDLQRRLANLSYETMTGELQPDKAIDAGKRFLTEAGLGDFARLYMVGEAISVQNLLTRATGNILNPNLELLFSKPTLRPFTFNFKLSPRSKDEAIEVKAIIRFFKQGMAPRIDNVSTLFVKSPYVFQIKYLRGDSQTHPGLNLIKRCALSNCVVDYTPNSSYMTYDGEEAAMTSYVINLTLQELVPVYNLDYDEDKNFGTESHPIGY